MFRYDGKNFFVKIISHLKKKKSHGIETFKKQLFLLKYSINLEKIFQNRVTILKKESILPKFIFHKNCLFEKKEKILTNQLFPTYLSTQVGENLIMPKSVGYFITTRKFFKLST